MSQPFLGQVWGFAQPPGTPSPQNALDAGAAAAGLGPGPAPAAPFVSVAGASPAPPPMMAPPSPPQDAPVPVSSPNEDPNRMMSIAPPAMSGGGAPVPPNVSMGVQAGPPPPPPAAGTASNIGGEQFDLARVGGGVMPAHEVERRGPSLKGAQEARNEFSEGTIGRINERNQLGADADYNLAVQQERQAQLRAQAQAQAAAEAQEEMAQRQADFDNTTKQMGQLGRVDRDRFWASRSTGQKVAGIVELMLSGFTGAPSMLQKRIDDDVKAQEFAYYAARDTANAKQTAFSMAMQKYANADAARAAARAASLDVVQSQLQQASAKWKGTETANKADLALAALQDEKMMQIASGIQFVPAMSSGPRFIDPRTGIQYTNAEAMAHDKEMRARNFGREGEVTKIGGQLTVDQAKAESEARANGGMSKAVHDDVLKKQIEAQMQLNADLATIEKAEGNIGKVTAGSTIGSAASHLPSFMPGVVTAKGNEAERESLNRRIFQAVAGAYKMGTDANEPKNKALLDHYVEPYVLTPRDNEESARMKMSKLRQFLTESAAAKGATGPQLSPEAQASLQVHGGK